MQKYIALFLVLIVSSLGVSAFDQVTKFDKSAQYIGQETNQNQETNQVEVKEVVQTKEESKETNHGQVVSEVAKEKEENVNHGETVSNVAKKQTEASTSNKAPKKEVEEETVTTSNVEPQDKSNVGVIYNVVKDSYVSDAEGDSNFGSMPFMAVGNIEDGHAKTYLAFDVAGISEEVFDSAEICLYKQNYLNDGQIEFNAALGDWDENSITSNNQPSVTTLGVGPVDVVQNWNCFDAIYLARLYQFFDRFGFVQEYGIMIDSSDGAIEFDSKEGVNAPYLILH